MVAIDQRSAWLSIGSPGHRRSRRVAPSGHMIFEELGDARIGRLRTVRMPLGEIRHRARDPIVAHEQPAASDSVPMKATIDAAL